MLYTDSHQTGGARGGRPDAVRLKDLLQADCAVCPTEAQRPTVAAATACPTDPADSRRWYRSRHHQLCSRGKLVFFQAFCVPTLVPLE